MKPMDGQEFHRVEDVSLGHFNEGKLPMGKGDVVLLPEVLLDCNGLRGAGCGISIINLVHPRVGPNQTLDHKVLVDRAAWVVRANPNLLDPTVHFIETVRIGLTTTAICHRA
jgi:hypothetical protein